MSVKDAKWTRLMKIQSDLINPMSVNPIIWWSDVPFKYIHTHMLIHIQHTPTKFKFN